MTEAVIIYKPVHWFAEHQWTGFYMITASVMKELNEFAAFSQMIRLLGFQNTIWNVALQVGIVNMTDILLAISTSYYVIFENWCCFLVLLPCHHAYLAWYLLLDQRNYLIPKRGCLCHKCMIFIISGSLEMHCK